MHVILSLDHIKIENLVFILLYAYFWDIVLITKDMFACLYQEKHTSLEMLYLIRIFFLLIYPIICLV